MDTRHQSGFTLWELLITLLVAGILVGIGVPNVRDAQRNSAMSSATNDLITALLAAKSEAVKRRVPVTLCASPDPTAANPVCSQTGAGANGGFIVWVDENGNLDPNKTPILTDATDGNGVVDPNEPILMRSAAQPSMAPAGPLRIFANSGYIVFGGNGWPLPAVPGPPYLTWVLYCDDRGNRHGSGGPTFSTARAIRVDTTGRGSVQTEQADIINALAQIGGGASCP
jgi:prepilin-type N-terminal cleavage/methylation domain-containing protein